MLAANFNVNNSTIVRRLKNLKRYRNWLDGSLTNSSNNNKAKRVLIFINLLQRNEWSPFLNVLVTEDEPWLFFKNLKRKKVYLWPGLSPKRIMKDVHCKKAMWCVWWNRSGIIHWEIILSTNFLSLE
ncbi:histone-lysine N-methyltransferase SETMAR [Trichonephila inaurata madagascariensis]|uniref:Histone-lysine N-methyltransferase SETMAR n=1 Tax=Trichonephila inaurata madagascariensis TaxID=2747483 RepID=A0A8X7CU96_9ARAC|nr:histone-lysine N-methyltransferase SETMAR [Trichonephila inaurata madagascariensis]